VLDEVREWQTRALDRMYPIVMFDALRVKIRDADSRLVKNKAVYVALGVTRDGVREVLGLWIAENEGAKFWLSVMTELKNRGVQDILIAVVDGLKGFPQAITAAFPEAMVQTCIVHLVRHSLRFCNWKDRRNVATDLREIYSAATDKQAAEILDRFEKKWAGKYPSIAPAWRRAWDEVIPFFAFDPAIRKIIYTTNAPSRACKHALPGNDRGPEPRDPEIHQNPWLVSDRGGRNQTDLSGHPEIRERWSKGPRMDCGEEPVRHNVRRSLQRVTVSETRMGPPGYTDFMTLPSRQS
jgi:hypothetical protein